MTFTLDAEGMFWNPTVNSIKLAKVLPKSPPELSGLVVGDELTEVEGMPVIGSKGKELMALNQRDAGRTLKLKIKRSNGEIKAITMSLATKS
jgi:C-terminal processing protease CtpA/Prc